ncbi:hypothetical protein RCL_jg13148.t1 [Rhizophagus clarus]|uniref:Uncharacterized protein n=1 Tax=Rhizophagus clarus TaxID=94130 RepID=A0A8H3QDD1_9GLOM|nr:hypothetical protein RCL_jg13148.t1 [Rhizophagus clarus]
MITAPGYRFELHTSKVAPVSQNQGPPKIKSDPSQSGPTTMNSPALVSIDASIGVFSSTTQFTNTILLWLESDELDSDELVSYDKLDSDELLPDDELDSDELLSDELLSDDELDSEELDSDELLSDEVDLGGILLFLILVSRINWMLKIILFFRFCNQSPFVLLVLQ